MEIKFNAERRVKVVELKRIKTMKVENLTPEAFVNIYIHMFKQLTFGYKCNDVSVPPPKLFAELSGGWLPSDYSEEKFKVDIGLILSHWDLIDADMGPCASEHTWDGVVYTHITTSLRKIEYNCKDKILSIDFGYDGSVTFAYEWVGEMAWLIGTQSIGVRNADCKPFVDFVDFS